MSTSLLSLIPPLIVVIIAIRTKRALEAMIVGALVGFILYSQSLFLTDFIYSVLDQIIDPTLAWVILFTCLVGGLIEILEAVRASDAFSKLALKYANTEKKTIFMTFIMAFVIFPDEYLRTLTLSSAMKDVSDKNKMPREMLGYVFSSVGVPVVILLPMTTWSIFFSGLLETSGIAAAGQGMAAYFTLLPYLLYPIISIVVFLLVTVGIMPKIGGIKKAYVAIKNNEYDYSQYISDLDVEEEEEERKSATLLDFIIPLVLLLWGALFTDLLIGTAAALLVSSMIYLVRKYVSIDELMEAFWTGFSAMIHPMAIVVLSFSLASVMDLLGFEEVIFGLEPFLIPEILPFIAFFITAALCYLTGEFWGISAIMLPAMLPLVYAFDVNVYLYAAAIFSGSAFGAHTCVFGDLNAIISSAIGVKQVDVALNATPYAMISGLLSGIGFLIIGFII